MANQYKNEIDISIFVNELRQDSNLPIKENGIVSSIVDGRSSTATRLAGSEDLVNRNFIQQSRYEWDTDLIDFDYIANGISFEDFCSDLKIRGKTLNHVGIELNDGFYNIGRNVYYLYGDNAQSSTLNKTITSFSNQDPVSPRYLAIWTRDIYNSAVPHRVVREVESYTGNLLDSGRESDISDTLDEYIYDSDLNKIILNKRIYETFDVCDLEYDTATNNEIYNYGDIRQRSNGDSCQTYYTKFFPISEGVRVFTINTLSDDRVGLIEWKGIGSWEDAEEDGYYFFFDGIRGILEFRGAIGSPTKLAQRFKAGHSVMYLEDASSLMSEGKISLASGSSYEVISYNGKIGNRLTGISYSGSVVWEPGTDVKPIRFSQVPKSNDIVVAFYTAYPRLDWGRKYINNRLNLNVSNGDIFQLQNQESFLCITRANQKLSSILLEIKDMGYIRTSDNETLYGPVYGYEDLVMIEGTVLDENQNPISNIDVEIYIKDGPGSINYSDSVIVRSNDNGKFLVYYVPDQDHIYSKFIADEDDVSYSGSTTRVAFHNEYNDLITSYDLNLISLFGIFKDDPTIGSIGKEIEIPISKYVTHMDFGNLIGSPLGIDRETYVLGHRWLDGIALVNNIDFDQHSLDSYRNGTIVIAYTENPYDGTDQPVSYASYEIDSIIRDSSLWVLDPPPISERYNTFIVGIKEKLTYERNSIVKCWLLRKSDEVWDSAKMNGRLNVLRVLQGNSRNDADYTPEIADDYYNDAHTIGSQWQHPSSTEMNVEGVVYKPVTPSAYAGNNIFIFSGNLPMPDKDSFETRLGGYAIFGSIKTTIEAKAKQKLCQTNYVISNEIKLLNTTGDRDNGTIENNMRYVPYGFRLLDTNIDTASTIDRNTYLTINNLHRVAYLDGSAEDSFTPLISVIDDGAIIYDSNSEIKTSINLAFEINAEE